MTKLDAIIAFGVALTFAYLIDSQRLYFIYKPIIGIGILP